MNIKKRVRPIPSHLDQTSCVKKDLLRDTVEIWNKHDGIILPAQLVNHDAGFVSTYERT